MMPRDDCFAKIAELRGKTVRERAQALSQRPEGLERVGSVDRDELWDDLDNRFDLSSRIADAALRNAGRGADRMGRIGMTKWVCSVCGYIHEGDNPPDQCLQCGAPSTKFKRQEGGDPA